MGSSAIYVGGDHLYVGFDNKCHMWWAVGREGSYGGDILRANAVQIAIDASALCGGRREIYVRDMRGQVEYIIKAVRTTPSSQLFQDSVP